MRICTSAVKFVCICVVFVVIVIIVIIVIIVTPAAAAAASVGVDGCESGDKDALKLLQHASTSQRLRVPIRSIGPCELILPSESSTIFSKERETQVAASAVSPDSRCMPVVSSIHHCDRHAKR